MKKKELFAISLLSILVFVSFANVAVAAPPSYVGVKKGDTFIWKASLNMANINTTAIALVGEDNWTYFYNYVLDAYENSTGMELDFFSGSVMKTVITNVTDEMPHPSMMLPVNGSGIYFDVYLAYSPNNWTLVSEGANYTYPMVFLVDPSALNETTFMYAFSGTPLFMPVGYDYSLAADYMQTMIASDPSTNGNMTFEVNGNGYKITLKAIFLESYYNMTGLPYELGPFLDVEINFRWNSIGVFSYASLVYGGLTIASVQLVTADDGLRPGYELVTILGVSLTTFIALVYTIRKKKVLK